MMANGNKRQHGQQERNDFCSLLTLPPPILLIVVHLECV